MRWCGAVLDAGGPGGAQDLNMDASMSMDEDQWSGSVINRRSDFKDAIHAFWVALHRCPPVSGHAQPPSAHAGAMRQGPRLT